LRERREDVPLLVDHLVRRAARECRKTVTEVSEQALEWLRGYHWPGNVRELAHVLERGVALAQQEVLTAEDLPEELRRPGPAAAPSWPAARASASSWAGSRWPACTSSIRPRRATFGPSRRSPLPPSWRSSCST